MNPQETEALHHPGARDLLDSATLLRLAYNGSDGLPRVIPIGFLWDGNQIVVCTAATAPKVKALSLRREVALTIDVGDTPADAKALLIRGVATVDIIDGVPDEYIAASKKVLHADQVAEFERQVRSLYDKMARIRIQPQWARFFDFGAGRLPRVLQTQTVRVRHESEQDARRPPTVSEMDEARKPSLRRGALPLADWGPGSPGQPRHRSPN